MLLFRCGPLWLATTVIAGKLVQHDAQFVPNHILRVTAQNTTFNCESRYSVVVNGSSPAPTLRLKGGKTAWIRVYNDMPSANLTMHWHGLSLRAAPFSDGSPQASQWPIAPGYFFDYEVRPARDEVGGTFFYHSHVGFQASSCKGALIVEKGDQDEEQEPYEYDDERIILLGDYYNKTDGTIERGLEANPFQWSGEPNSLLVNGQSGTNSAGTDQSCAPFRLDVEPGTTYRLRFIGGTALSHILLAIEDHNELSIIEADGHYTRPHTVSHLQVASGQRFSVLFKAKTAAELSQINKTNFWIQLESRDRPTNVTGYALLSYKTPNTPISTTQTPPQIPPKPPLTLPSITYNWLEYALSPLSTNPKDPSTTFPCTSEITRRITITIEQITPGSSNWFQNALSWVENKTYIPFLVDIYQRGEAAIPNYTAAVANGGWDPKTLAFPAKMGEVIELVWQNTNGAGGGWDAHPMHAHGSHYWDVGSGNGTFDPSANEERLRGYTPVRRDTTMLYRYAVKGVPHTAAGWRAWRFRVTNPGVWMVHCHILQHMVMGMQTAWVFGNAKDILESCPSKCPSKEEVSGYLTYKGAAYGNNTYAPTVMHNFDP